MRISYIFLKGMCANTTQSQQANAKRITDSSQRYADD